MRIKNKTYCAQKMDFLSIGQKDAQWSVSPLWVRIKRVWALRARFTTVFGCSLIFRKKKPSIHGIHGYPWHPFLIFFPANQRTPKNSCKTSAQSPNSLHTNPKGGNGPLRIFLAYAQEIHFLNTTCLIF